MINLKWGLGIGDWGLGDLGIGPNPQSPIPNPQSPIPNPHIILILTLIILFNIIKFKNIKLIININYK